MAAEDYRKALRRYFAEVINEGKLDVIGELFEQGSGRGDAAMHAADSLRRSFPDLHMTVDDLVVEGDRAVVKVTCTGTHAGTFMGLAATGRSVRFEGVELAQFNAYGQIVGEVWHVMDTGAVYRQLGVLGGHHGG